VSRSGDASQVLGTQDVGGFASDSWCEKFVCDSRHMVRPNRLARVSERCALLGLWVAAVRPDSDAKEAIRRQTYTDTRCPTVHYPSQSRGWGALGPRDAGSRTVAHVAGDSPVC
jgi:hypothetical protein